MSPPAPTPTPLHARLPDGPLDIVGDVHGEVEALDALLAACGYDTEAQHPDGRTLVFIGDLVDRGPDSPAVVARVRRWMAAGRAVAILGNHELNLLRAQRKQGNDWFWGEGAVDDAMFLPTAGVSIEQRADLLAFFDTLPLALSRDDLRIVHAVWHAPSLARLAAADRRDGLAALFQRFDADAETTLAEGGWLERSRAQKAQWRAHFHDASAAIPMLDAVGHVEEARQGLNPLRVLTSGLERQASTPFFASGKWRFAQRVRWWDDYRDDVPVVVGHYWRSYRPVDRAMYGKNDADLFEDIAPQAWLGPHGRVFCVDFSVGGRWRERRDGRVGERTRLAALRWPERVLVTESGERIATVGPG